MSGNMVRIQCVVEEKGVRCGNAALISFLRPVSNPEEHVGGWLCPEHDQVYAWGSQVLAGEMMINETSFVRNLALDRAADGKKNPFEGWKEVKKFGHPINDTLLIRVDETKDRASADPTRKDIKKYFPGPRKQED